MTTKLNEIQRAVLSFAAKNGKIDFFDACRLGANGASLSSLTKKGLLAKSTDASSGTDWTLTDAGKQVIAA